MSQWGEFQGRIEDNRLITGQGLYVGDVAPERMTHSVVVRAQVASARVTSIDTDAALASPGVLAVYTGNTVSTLSLIASNDDVAPTIHQSALSFAASAGTPYRIAVDGYNGAVGTVVLNLNPPANDDFANALGTSELRRRPHHSDRPVVELDGAGLEQRAPELANEECVSVGELADRTGELVGGGTRIAARCAADELGDLLTGESA